MTLYKWFAPMALVFILGGCWTSEKPITGILVEKSERKMYLVSGNKVAASYDIDLGKEPVGHKQFEGDLKTPEGTYYVDRKNPRSQFYLSLGISYPNPQDRAFAKARGKSAGGDIFIHGESPTDEDEVTDWTAGCIAVSNEEIKEIFMRVKTGTPITINP